MKRLIETILLECVYLINIITPKRENQLFFYSFPDYSDNARAIFEKVYLSENGRKYNYVWAVRNVEKYRKILPSDVKVVKHRSLINMMHFCRSKYLIRTHSLWGNKYACGKQYMCIAWHGMAMKEDSLAEPVACDLLISTSPLFQKKLSREMGVVHGECKVTGLPRNDLLFSNSAVFKEMCLDKYEKTIVWMPTYRKGFGNNDGLESELGLPTVPVGGLDTINRILAQKNILLLLRLHPIAQNKLKDIKYSNIRTLANEDVPDKYTVYEVIGQTDALITDYSSISVDYLLIDKPMLFVMDDMEEYRKTRGFPFEPFEDYLAGDKIKQFDELVKWFQNFDGNDSYSSERKRMRELFHTYADDKSTERVIAEMGL